MNLRWVVAVLIGLLGLLDCTLFVREQREARVWVVQDPEALKPRSLPWISSRGKKLCWNDAYSARQGGPCNFVPDPNLVPYYPKELLPEQGASDAEH